MMDITKKNQALYQEKLTTPEGVAAQVKDGQRIFMDIALAQPKAILDALCQRARQGRMSDVSLSMLMDIYPADCYQPDPPAGLHTVSLFCGAGARRAVNAGQCDLLPGYYRDFPRIIRENREVNVFCAAAAPMDSNGYFSLGTAASVSQTLIDKADVLLLEVNEHVPYSFSAPVIHISQVTALCENNMQLPAMKAAELDEVSLKIGALIANEVRDGSTLQLGIGAIPDAVGMALREKHNLGIHTEMFTDSMVELLQCGAVDNSRKPIHRGRSVATFAFGSQRIYDYIDHNRAIEMLPVEYVNDPAVIARHPNFVSVNSALEVDFFGQVCAESIGTYQVSGTGGQVDYVRGAVLSPGGQSFIAFPSTAKGGTVSRIMPTLTPGAIVTTGKNDVDNIVTEYGIARLRGRTLRERTENLIAIAHPKFREELRYAAKKRNILI
ncbi:acetyl-CoA hydrolase/transferase family protein [Intestinimonas massiliensis (ex Afouda et al. 2020)]|uniref:acetyl-CoA hydrolase/transferase family protein n=1 Tax=Intestinimonas massiliensis (ex Afouda et al. 2020) TaxID=1673721 RepID=UPI001F5EF090|nr:acetyl-CoA hydrolase/transferase C-terminal domain-containing protein [Intestinimonas massiliensis (ex Afouda et al. 2020)]